MKIIIVLALSALAFSATTAAAGNPNLCAKDGWATAQSSSGQAFASMKDCAKAREVFQPTLAIDPARVVAGERFTLTATGFHPDARLAVFFAITGQPPYFAYDSFYPFAADGSFSIPFAYAECRKTPTGEDVSVDLTISIVDEFGVHASAPLTLC